MIALCMNQNNYENDIRALLMAFFYGEKIVLNAENANLFLDVNYFNDSIKIKIKSDKQELETIAKCQLTNYKTGRNQVKTALYHLLHEFTGRELPWGTLTGIRPTKLPMEMLEQGATFEEAADYLQNEYLVSKEKAVLCVQVAENEALILNSIDYKNTYSLYVGIPFCPSICAYCSFSSYPLSVWEKQVDDYLDALIHEIEAVSNLMKGKRLLTFYMGGGTPTSLTAEQMDRLLSNIEKYFDLKTVREITIEAGRPDSITRKKLEVIKKHGIDRISINPQTMHQDTLDLIGRKHTVEQIQTAFKMAREIGFNNINMDLIAGLPGETSVQMQKTMDEIIALRPDSVTVHALALKRAAFLNQNREQFPVAETEEVNKMIGISYQGATAIGAEPYYLYRQKNIAGNLENVGYARKGCEGLYNILIMEEKQTILALGAGASSKFVFPSGNGVRIERVENVKSVKDYIERIDEMIDRKRMFIASQNNIV